MKINHMKNMSRHSRIKQINLINGLWCEPSRKTFVFREGIGYQALLRIKRPVFRPFQLKDEAGNLTDRSVGDRI